MSNFSTTVYFSVTGVGMNFQCTDGNNILHTLLVKHYNDLLERQRSERGKDEVSYFYVGDVFCIHLGTMIFYVIHKVWNFFPEIYAKIFS